MAEVSPISLRCGTPVQFPQKQQELFEALPSQQASTCNKRKKWNEDPGTDGNGKELADDLRSVKRKRVCGQYGIDVADHSHPAPSKLISFPRSQIEKKWEYRRQELYNEFSAFSKPYCNKAPSTTSEPRRAYKPPLSNLAHVASKSNSTTTAVTKFQPQQACKSFPSLPTELPSELDCTTSPSTILQPRQIYEGSFSIPFQLARKITDNYLDILRNGKEPAEINNTNDQPWQQEGTISLQDLDLGRKDPDEDPERPPTPPSARKIDEAWKLRFARYNEDNATYQPPRDEMTFDCCCVIYDESFDDKLNEELQQDQIQLDEQSDLSYWANFWTLPKPVLPIPKSRYVLDDDEAWDGNPSKLFILASESVKRKKMAILGAFEDVDYHGEEISVEGWESPRGDHSPEVSPREFRGDSGHGGSDSRVVGWESVGLAQSWKWPFKGCALWDAGMQGIQKSKLW